MISFRVIGLFLIGGSIMLPSCATVQTKSLEKHVKHAVAPLNVEINGKKIGFNQFKEYQPVNVEPKSDRPTKDKSFGYIKLLNNSNHVLYSLRAKGPIRDVLRLFSESNPKHFVNISVDGDVSGKVDVSFRKLPINQALQSILQSLGLYYVKSDGLVMIKDMETKTFTVDYPRLVRTGNFSVRSSMSGTSSNSGSSSGSGGGSGYGGGSSSFGSGSSGSSGGSGAGNGAGASVSGSDISTTDKIDFWADLEADMRALISKDASLSINKLSGTIVVRDHHRNIQTISDYIESTAASVRRQAVIVAQILKVSGKNNENFSIDWGRLTSSVIARTGTAIANPFGIAGALSQPSVSMTLQNKGSSISAIVSALKEQGKVRVVSNPQIRTLNNQPAMIKVGRERSFFSIETIVNSTTAGNTITTNDRRQDVTIGLLLSVTPQISADGEITMDISPSISSLTGVDKSQSGSTAPIMDVQQLSSMVRVKSGESVVIGGLIQSTDSDTLRSVPLLGDIPFIGSLFRSTAKIHKNDELVIILTPYMVIDKR